MMIEHIPGFFSKIYMQVTDEALLARTSLSGSENVTMQLFIALKGHSFCITKTYLYNFDPLEPQFYIVKLAFTGVCINFLFPLKNIDWGTR